MKIALVAMGALFLGSIGLAMKPTGPLSRLRFLYTWLLDGETRCWLRFGDALASLGIPLDHTTERERAVAWFESRYAEFRAGIPADRRIEFRVTDGWAPLCAHLGVPVPTVRDAKTGALVEAPFPRVNDRAAFLAASRYSQARALARSNAALLDIVARACLTAVVAYGGYLAWKRR